MSRDEIHQIAQSDTPQAVNVPNTLAGLIIWATGRFGTSLTIAVVASVALSWAIQRVYVDLAAQNAVVVEIVRAQAVSNETMAQTLRELSKAVENNTRAISEERMRSLNK